MNQNELGIYCAVLGFNLLAAIYLLEYSPLLTIFYLLWVCFGFGCLLSKGRLINQALVEDAKKRFGCQSGRLYVFTCPFLATL